MLHRFKIHRYSRCLFFILEVNTLQKKWYLLFALLSYCKEENRFIHLLPCYYTRKKFQSLYDSSFLTYDDNVVILEKRSKKEGVRRPQAPLWCNDVIVNHFDPFTQFHVFDVFSLEDNNVGKVERIVKKSSKEYFKFVKESLLLTVL